MEFIFFTLYVIFSSTILIWSFLISSNNNDDCDFQKHYDRDFQNFIGIHT